MGRFGEARRPTRQRGTRRETRCRVGGFSVGSDFDSAEAVEVGCDLFGGGRRCIPLDHVPRRVDEKLLEVPGDIGGFSVAWLLALEERVERSFVVPVDIDLREHREVHVEFRLRELEDFGIGAGLLIGELVARNAEDDEVVIVIVERTQTCVLRREASSACDVDDEDELAVVVSEVDLVARDGRHVDVVEFHGG
jgi:hypothetical protein